MPLAVSAHVGGAPAGARNADAVGTGRPAGLLLVSDMEKVYDLFFRFPSVCYLVHHVYLRGRFRFPSVCPFALHVFLRDRELVVHSCPYCGCPGVYLADTDGAGGLSPAPPAGCRALKAWTETTRRPRAGGRYYAGVCAGIAIPTF